MNSVDGACAICGCDSPYTGRLPIFCESCRKAREAIANGQNLSYMDNPKLAVKLMLPDSEFMPKPVTL